MTSRMAIIAVLWVCACASAAAERPDAASTLPAVRLAPGGHGFVTADGKPFVPLGVNYYRPGTGWAPQLWKKFDPDATRQDFARMKELGIRCVRVFLTYGSFFTEPGTLDPQGLAKFDQFMRMAEASGIYVHPTGPDHWEGIPAWVPRDRLADEKSLAALEQFWKLFAARYRGRSVLFAYDLLNEPSVPWDTPALHAKWNRWLDTRYGSADKLVQAWAVASEHVRWGDQPPPPPKEAPGSGELLDYQRFREEIADEWTRRQATAIKAADPDALVTVGVIQWSVPALLPGVQHYAAFRPDRQARYLDFLEVHFYPLNRGAYQYRSDEEEARNLAYLESVVREVARPAKPVVVAEFGWYGGGKPNFGGGKQPAATEEQQARWCRRAVETTEGLATGWLNWGFFDHPEAKDVSELTGLLTHDGKVKAWGREFRALANRFQGRAIPPRALSPRPALDWDRCVTSTAAGHEFREAYYRAVAASR